MNSVATRTGRANELLANPRTFGVIAYGEIPTAVHLCIYNPAVSRALSCAWTNGFVFLFMPICFYDLVLGDKQAPLFDIFLQLILNNS